MRQRHLFDRLCVYVCPDTLRGANFELLECCLRDGGAALSSDAHAMAVTHVVCHPHEYTRFAGGRRDRFFAIVRPEWVFRAFALQKLLPVDKFSADPRLFFSTFAIAAGSIDKDPRKVIDGLIAHFGGQIVEDVTDSGSATHVLSPDGSPLQASVSDAQQAFQLAYAEADVARQVELWQQWLDERPASLDFSLPGCLVAHVGQNAGLNVTHHVNYAWIEECVRRKQRVDEAPFSKGAIASESESLPSWKSRPDVKVEDLNLEKFASVYLNARAAAAATTGELAAMRKISPERLAAMQQTLAGAIVLVAQHIPSQLKEPVAEILKAAKAKVANVPLGDSYADIVRKVVANASFVVCRHQTGLEYEEAVRQKKRVVSVYWVIAGLGVTSEGGPLREALLCPVKGFGGVAGMESFVITLSGFNSRTMPTREDVQMAIQATGACVLPVLSRSHSTHLLCYEAKGEKFKKAQSWSFDNILSHEWLLECLLQWKYAPEGPFRMVTSSASAGATAEIATAAAEAETDDAAAVEVSNTGPPTSGPRAKAVGARFDVDELLDELNEPTPKSKKGGGTLKLDAAAAEVSAKLFDTPSKATRASRRGEVSPAKGNGEASIPEDFEFQFGKKAKSRGKAKPADRKVMFEAKEPEREADVGKSKCKSKRDNVDAGSGVGSVEEREQDTTLIMDEADEGKSAAGVKTSTTKPAAKKSAPSRKRKSGESTPAAEDSGSVAAKTKPVSPATKKKKTAAVKDDHGASTASSVSTLPKGEDSSRFFLLTGSREECAINESIVLALGGRVSQVAGRIYDPQCTHIISSELKRTEKFVAGCAAGKWILRQSYLEASSAAGRFVDEGDHEWGANEVDVDEMDPRIWPPVCSYWRKARATNAQGAFAGWRFVVHPKAVPPPDMCERVIAASDGEVIPLSTSVDLAAAAANATKQKPVVALVHAELSSRDTWLKKFKASKLQCVNASFLIDFLTKDQTNRPKIDDYVL